MPARTTPTKTTATKTTPTKTTPTRTASTTKAATARRSSPRRSPVAGARRAQSSRSWMWIAVAVVVALAVLFAVFRANSGSSAAAGGGPTSYQVGSPGIGAQAPGFDLPASTGGSVSLSSLRGKTVLLYFQEGVGCEPCWTQMKDLEANTGAVTAAGVDQIVSITTQPVNLLAQKARDEGITTPVLADTDLAVSKAYNANQYGMMGDSMDGHSFVLVGPDGTIQWRADYGGAPKYTMDVPVDQLLGDLKSGRHS
ncbi:peroxiredoxin Q/BCP [Modestobacter sp. DSM 44400]|uniref:peroxiredoxin family protein n=1 Tax=Modestobacter sp. DSM 44400 TaxID=1550230 RepID=UPI00089BD7E8|nr:peroxiredoxin family protein [Modestobacter sp. DSM 44400]SDY65795.1 peroxiredoxin Q/BCP [Modestobacter sp. DSM 44400]